MSCYYFLFFHFLLEMTALYLYVHTYIRTYIHTYIHTCIHPSIHVYIHTYSCRLVCILVQMLLTVLFVLCTLILFLCLSVVITVFSSATFSVFVQFVSTLRMILTWLRQSDELSLCLVQQHLPQNESVSPKKTVLIFQI
jgi:hypothetical protein